MVMLCSEFFTWKESSRGVCCDLKFINEYVAEFNRLILTLPDRHASLRLFRKGSRGFDRRWLTHEIGRVLVQRYAVRIHWRRTREYRDRCRYKKHQNHNTAFIKKVKADYFNSRFRRSNNIRSELRSLGVIRGRHTSSITALDIHRSIIQIKSNAVRLDEIPILFIKLLLPVILSSIIFLFDKILTSSTFPINRWVEKKDWCLTLPRLRPSCFWDVE